MEKEYKPDQVVTDSVYRVLVEDCGPFELREKASRFIAFAAVVGNATDVDNTLQRYRKKFYDATHLCYAYRLRDKKNEIRRCSDDGEPSGTAGAPILQEIMGKDIWNVLVMVVRYFGGTKLGTGGLSRAFAGAARMAMDAAKTTEVEPCHTGSISFSFNDTGLVMQWLNRYRAIPIGQEFSDRGIVMTCSLPDKEMQYAKQALIDMSSGRLLWRESRDH